MYNLNLNIIKTKSRLILIYILLFVQLAKKNKGSTRYQRGLQNFLLDDDLDK